VLALKLARTTSGLQAKCMIDYVHGWRRASLRKASLWVDMNGKRTAELSAQPMR
jgi:hypothetical protein